MIDALLYAVRDHIRTFVPSYGHAECGIQDDGRPNPSSGNYFVAVHGGHSTPGEANQRNLYELFGFSVTLTQRVVVPLDRVGEAQIARNIALVPLGIRQGFHARLEQLRAFLHMNWKMTVLTFQVPGSANDNIAAWATGTVYGFCEPAHYSGIETVRLVGGEWFGAEPDDESMGLVSELRFEGAKRFQPTTAPVGSFT